MSHISSELISELRALSLTRISIKFELYCLRVTSLRFLMHRPQGRCVFLVDRFGDAPQFRADNLFRAL